MTPLFRSSSLAAAALPIAIACTLSACGGGGGASETAAPKFSAACWDGSTASSSFSQEAANASCPLDYRLVTSVSPASYSGNYASEKLAVFNRLNDDRSRCGFGKIAQNALLDQAAQNHANYLATGSNFRDGHSEIVGNPGFTGANPASRIAFTGYRAAQTSEGISSPFFWGTAYKDISWTAVSGGQTIHIPITSNPPLVDGLRNLYTAPYHMMDLMTGYREIGIGSVYADRSDIYSTDYLKALIMNYATPQGMANQQFAADTVVTFPCEGTIDMNPYFTGENPNPFPEKGSTVSWGQPVLVMAQPGATLKLTSGTITLRGGNAVPTKQLVRNRDANAGADVAADPHALMGNHQVFLVPTVALTENATYDVVLQGTNSKLVTPANPTGSWNKSFSFKTSVMTHAATP